MNMKEMKEKTANHLRKHKEAYIVGAIAGGSCLLIGAAGGAVVMVRKPDSVIAQKMTGLIWKPKQTMINNIINVKFGEPKGKPGIRLLCVETNTPYESIADASMKTGVSRAAITAFLKGKSPDADGLHFINFGPAPVPEGATSPVAA